jgi:threonine aldolase
LHIDLTSVQTNIVILRVDRPGGVDELAKGCAARKVKIHAMSATAVRCVTHKDIDADDIGRALDAFKEITKGW